MELEDFTKLQITKNTLREFAENDTNIETDSGRAINNKSAYFFIREIYGGDNKKIQELDKFYEKLKLIKVEINKK